MCTCEYLSTNLFNIVADKIGKRELEDVIKKGVDIDSLTELQKRGRGTNAINIISTALPIAYDLLKGELLIMHKNLGEKKQSLRVCKA